MSCESRRRSQSSLPDEPLVELPHDALRRRLQHAARIDSGFNQLVVQLATSRKQGDARKTTWRSRLDLEYLDETSSQSVGAGMAPPRSRRVSPFGMPSSWNQLKQSGFPLSDYAKEIPFGEYEVIVDGVCYAKSSSRIGTGKHWFFVHYLPGHASHLRAKELRAGDQVCLIVEAGRNGRGPIKDVIPRVAAK